MSEEGIDSVRAQLNQMEKELKTANSTIEKLTTENRQYQAKEAFTQAELNPALASWFLAEGPTEITKDAAVAFAEMRGVADLKIAPPEEGAPVPAPTPAPADNPDLALIGKAGSRGGDGGQPSAGTATLTTKEYQELARTDKEAAAAAVADGRVKLSDQNAWVKDRPDMTGSNPYANRGAQE